MWKGPHPRTGIPGPWMVQRVVDGSGVAIQENANPEEVWYQLLWPDINDVDVLIQKYDEYWSRWDQRGHGGVVARTAD
eukprot:1834841-Heterocapsa_arctica.AAC.1